MTNTTRIACPDPVVAGTFSGSDRPGLFFSKPILVDCEVNYVHTTKSRTRVIYSLKELAHFWSKLLGDFLHVQCTDFMPYWRHSKHVPYGIKNIFKIAPPQDADFVLFYYQNIASENEFTLP
jgi:hypothetical protein